MWWAASAVAGRKSRMDEDVRETCVRELSRRELVLVTSGCGGPGEASGDVVDSRGSNG